MLPEILNIITMLAELPTFRRANLASIRMRTTGAQQYLIRVRSRCVARGYNECFEKLPNGRQDGVYIHIYANGQCAWIDRAVNGVRHGIVAHWYYSGQPRMRYMFVNGVRHGEYLGWWASGHLRKRYTHVNGVRHGEYKRWAFGKLTEHRTYEHGVIWSDLDTPIAGNLNA